MAKATKTPGKKKASAKVAVKKSVKVAAKKNIDNKKASKKPVKKKAVSIKKTSSGNKAGSKHAHKRKSKKTHSLPFTGIDTIPVFDAISYTESWQRYNEHPHHSKGTSEYIRAFKLPFLDVIQLAKLAKKYKFIAYRAYLGIGILPAITMPENPTRFMKLMLVGIRLNSAGEECDFIADPDGNSFVYDLSTPCPNTCDYQSVLYKK